MRRNHLDISSPCTFVARELPNFFPIPVGEPLIVHNQPSREYLVLSDTKLSHPKKDGEHCGLPVHIFRALYFRSSIVPATSVLGWSVAKGMGKRSSRMPSSARGWQSHQKWVPSVSRFGEKALGPLASEHLQLVDHPPAVL